MRPLGDRYGRVATDLRVSLTDRCNLRCSYCMPAEGLEWLPDDSVLTDDEIVRLVDIAVHLLGVREVRFTGGEPLVRRGLVDIVAAHRAAAPRPEISMTTNALGLARTAHALKAAGLDRVNVSLDTSGRTPSTRSPGATGSTTWSPGSRRPRRPGWLRSRSTPS